jgi:ribosome maturation factor RimP
MQGMEKYIGKKVKIVYLDGTFISIFNGTVTGVNEQFLFGVDENNRDIGINLSKIDKITSNASGDSR